MCNYKKRPMCEIENEIKKYENSSSFKIKTVINVFKFLRFLNGDLFYFLFTLSIFLGTKFFLTNNLFFVKKMSVFSFFRLLGAGARAKNYRSRKFCSGSNVLIRLTPRYL